MKNLFNCTPYPVWNKAIVCGDGCYVIDDNGNRYLDLESGVWCAALGHNNKHVNAAIRQQMDRISHVGYRYNSAVAEQAAETLLYHLGMSEGNSLFLSSGSEAVEFSVQTAIHLAGPGKPKLLCLKDYFLSSYGESSQRDGDNWISLSLQEGEDAAWKEEIDNLPFDQIGAFVFEPGNASGLVRLPPKNAISYLAKRVREAGGLLVLDEVTTGMGRTGRWFGFSHYDLQPDIVACGKGLGNGYPVSAVALAAGLGKRLLETGFRYAQSHQNDPLGAAVVCAVCKELDRGGLVAAAEEKGAFLLSGLDAVAKQGLGIKEVRGRGLMVALTLEERVSVESIHRQLLEKGFLLGINPLRRALRIYPPLIITTKELQNFLQTFKEILEAQQF